MAIRIIKNTNYKFGIVMAEKQKKGRGQYGKKWVSYKGNLFASIFFPIDKIKLTLGELTKINCLLVRKLLLHFYKGKITIKKPNDLFIHGKKISGILQETLTKSGETFIIIGIGINLVKSPKIKNYPTINLFELVNKRLDKTVIENELKVFFEKNLSKLYKISYKLNKI